MKRMGLAVGGVAALALLACGAAVGAGPADATSAGTPMPIACGRAISNFGWGAASASGIEVALHQIQEGGATGATPPAGSRLVGLDVTITNKSPEPLTYALADFELLDCNGLRHASIPGGQQPAITRGTLAPGAVLRGWISFALPQGVRPALFTEHIKRTGQTGASVQFPLAAVTLATPGATNGAAAPATCVAGIAVGGNGQNGANAVGGSAVGGNATGGNATGGSASGGEAIGGNGSNGGDAIGGAAGGCA